MGVVIGIDPGVNGAIAAIANNGRVVLLHEMPTVLRNKTGKKQQIDAAGLHKLLNRFCHTAEGENIIVGIEHVHAMPGQGVSSMFNMGDSFGVIRGIVASLQLVTHFISPVAWKKYYKIKSDKELSRALAIQFFPAVDLHRKKDSDKAEALLLAKYTLENFTANQLVV